MDVVEGILTRRSIRKFVLREIPDNVVQRILKAGMTAPSAGNQRPWQYVVVRDRSMMEKIIEAYPYAKMLRDCPVAIIVCFDRSLEKYEERWQMDCANTTLSMLLAAHGLGLGGLWLEIYPVTERIPKVRDSFGMPENIVPFAVVAVGHPSERVPPAERYDEARIHVDKW